MLVEMKWRPRLITVATTAVRGLADVVLEVGISDTPFASTRVTH